MGAAQRADGALPIRGGGNGEEETEKDGETLGAEAEEKTESRQEARCEKKEEPIQGQTDCPNEEIRQSNNAGAGQIRGPASTVFCAGP